MRRSGLVSCQLLGEARPLVEIRFSLAEWSRLAKLLVSGVPPGARDRLVLNVDSPSMWKLQLDRLIAGR